MGPLSRHCEINIISITYILQDNISICLLIIIISFQRVLHFDVGINEIEWNLKVKTEM